MYGAEATVPEAELTTQISSHFPGPEHMALERQQGKGRQPALKDICVGRARKGVGEMSRKEDTWREGDIWTAVS